MRVIEFKANAYVDKQGRVLVDKDQEQRALPALILAGLCSLDLGPSPKMKQEFIDYQRERWAGDWERAEKLDSIRCGNWKCRKTYMMSKYGVELSKIATYNLTPPAPILKLLNSKMGKVLTMEPLNKWYICKGCRRHI